MRREKFDRIATAAELLSERHPRWYRFRLLAMAVVGYVYVIGLLAVLAGMFAGMLWATTHARRVTGGHVQALIVLGLLIYVFVKSLRVRIEPPGGLLVTAAEAPGLFDLVERVRSRLKAPAPHVVLVNEEFNACVAQVPRLGFLGWHRNYLAVGLPLLQAVSPAQFESILAHEFGHLSGAHGKFGVWIYRLQQTWHQLVANLAESRSVLTLLVVPFFRWLVPRFSAYSLVQNRRQEYEADRRAAEAVGASVTAAALTRIHLLGERLGARYWPDYFKRADAESAPPDPLGPMPGFFRLLNDPEDAARRLRRSLQEVRETDDTHPPLSERLAALRAFDPSVPADPAELAKIAVVAGENAAERMLGDRLEPIRDELSARWRESVAEGWKSRWEEMREKGERLATLEREGKDDTEWERICLAEEVRGSDAALPLYRAYLERHPDHAGARYSIGRLLLEAKDPAGLAFLEEVMAKEPDSRPTACELIAAYHYEAGDVAAARHWRRKAIGEHEDSDEVEQERRQLRDRDRFEPHGLDEKALGPLRSQLEAIAEVDRAWLVRKKVKLRPEQPCYILVVARRQPWWRAADSRKEVERNQALGIRLAAELKPDLALRFFILSRTTLRRRVEKVRDSEIFRRGG